MTASRPPVLPDGPHDHPQVGRGWAFPVRWDAAGAVAVSSGERRVAEALRVVLRTDPGTRVMRPEFGAGVDAYVFEPRTDEVLHRLEADVRRALLLAEPRVLVEQVTATPGGADDRVDVLVEYRIDRHRRPSSLVLPFDVGTAATGAGPARGGDGR